MERSHNFDGSKVPGRRSSLDDNLSGLRALFEHDYFNTSTGEQEHLEDYSHNKSDPLLSSPSSSQTETTSAEAVLVLPPFPSPDFDEEADQLFAAHARKSPFLYCINVETPISSGRSSALSGESTTPQSDDVGLYSDTELDELLYPRSVSSNQPTKLRIEVSFPSARSFSHSESPKLPTSHATGSFKDSGVEELAPVQSFSDPFISVGRTTSALAGARYLSESELEVTPAASHDFIQSTCSNVEMQILPGRGSLSGASSTRDIAETGLTLTFDPEELGRIRSSVTPARFSGIDLAGPSSSLSLSGAPITSTTERAGLLTKSPLKKATPARPVRTIKRARVARIENPKSCGCQYSFVASRAPPSEVPEFPLGHDRAAFATVRSVGTTLPRHVNPDKSTLLAMSSVSEAPRPSGFDMRVPSSSSSLFRAPVTSTTDRAGVLTKTPLKKSPTVIPLRTLTRTVVPRMENPKALGCQYSYVASRTPPSQVPAFPVGPDQAAIAPVRSISTTLPRRVHPDMSVSFVRVSTSEAPTSAGTGFLVEPNIEGKGSSTAKAVLSTNPDLEDVASARSFSFTDSRNVIDEGVISSNLDPLLSAAPTSISAAFCLNPKAGVALDTSSCSLNLRSANIGMTLSPEISPAADLITPGLSEVGFLLDIEPEEMTSLNALSSTHHECENIDASVTLSSSLPSVLPITSTTKVSGDSANLALTMVPVEYRNFPDFMQGKPSTSEAISAETAVPPVKVNTHTESPTPSTSTPSSSTSLVNTGNSNTHSSIISSHSPDVLMRFMLPRENTNVTGSMDPQGTIPSTIQKSKQCRKRLKFSPRHLCSDCGQMTVTVHQMRWHMKAHNSGKDFQCLKCTCAFARAVSLQKHMENAHEFVPRGFGLVAAGASASSASATDVSDPSLATATTGDLTGPSPTEFKPSPVGSFTFRRRRSCDPEFDYVCARCGLAFQTSSILTCHVVAYHTI